MAQASDFTIANQSFPNFRTDLNTVLSAINLIIQEHQDQVLQQQEQFG